MNRLWAPWRTKYVTYVIKQSKRCVFCKILKEKNDTKNYIFIRRLQTFSVLNLYPYNNGHSLILPSRHVDDFDKLSEQERRELFDLLGGTKRLLDEVLKPEGYNIGVNLGRIAGAGFPDHLHIHLVPRWKGDVNFMPVIGGTKVISQSLNILYKQLIDAQKRRH